VKRKKKGKERKLSLDKEPSLIWVCYQVADSIWANSMVVGLFMAYLQGSNHGLTYCYLASNSNFIFA